MYLKYIIRGEIKMKISKKQILSFIMALAVALEYVVVDDILNTTEK